MILGYIILAYLNTRDDEHPIFSPRPLRLRPNFGKIVIKIISPNGQVELSRKLTYHVITAHDMVRDDNNIKTCLAEKIDRIPHLKRTVRKGSVNMKIAQKH